MELLYLLQATPQNSYDSVSLETLLVQKTKTSLHFSDKRHPISSKLRPAAAKGKMRMVGL